VETSIRVSAELAERAVAAYDGGVPDAVVAEARKAMLNVVGTAVGASASDGVDAIVDVGQRIDSPAAGFVPGRAESVDLYTAAMATGAAAHWEDFDDGHDSLRIHPGPSSLGSCLVVGRSIDADLGSVLRAYAICSEIQFRLAAAIQPQHYRAGWHTTATVGAIATSVATACLLGQRGPVVEQGIGIATSEAAGLRQGFGTGMKPLNAGKAAANGILAAFLARRGIGGYAGALERPGGFLAAFGEGPAVERVLDGFGVDWHFLGNTYKPYPCGRIVHPMIDAGLDLRAELGRLDGEGDRRELRSVEIECHPLTETLTGIPDPQTGLETKFSAAHGVAVALVRGRAGVQEFTDESAVDPAIKAMRDRVRLQLRTEDGPSTAVVTVRVTLQSGRTLESTVTEARGTLGHPLTFDEVRDKAETLIEPALPGRAPGISRLLESAPSGTPVRRLVDLLTPAGPDARRAAR
jgi:2-methylcitrate dehydratase PrpD